MHCTAEVSRAYNVRKYFEKNVAVEIGNVKSTHAIARVKFQKLEITPQLVIIQRKNMKWNKKSM